MHSFILPKYPHGRRRRERRLLILGLSLGLIVAVVTGALIYFFNLRGDL